MTFAWDAKKAADSFKKHGVDFREAATVFEDSLSTTFPDSDHSAGEQRFLIIGMSARRRLLVGLPTAKWTTLFESSAQESPRGVNGSSMKKNRNSASGDELRPEYDFASMKGGVRGKYVRRARERTNIVVIEPEISEAFPTEQAVNEALRGVLNTARAVRSTGGLPDKALRPASRVRRKARLPGPARAVRN